MDLKSRLSEILKLGFREEALPQLQAYVDLLWAANEELNLFSRQMKQEELIDNHVIDCLLPIAHFPTDCKVVADFGSGGGLPGVIYAIQFPQIQFRLFEKSPKKQAFLKRCQKIAPNLQIFGEIPKDLKDVDLVSARAFKPLDVIIEMSAQYYKNGGKYFLMKARMEKINEEIADTKKKFKDFQTEILPLKSPILDVERNLLLVNMSRA